jgi:hypothetical protein
MFSAVDREWQFGCRLGKREMNTGKSRSGSCQVAEGDV